jgi:hypothetical protein
MSDFNNTQLLYTNRLCRYIPRFVGNNFGRFVRVCVYGVLFLQLFCKVYYMCSPSSNKVRLCDSVADESRPAAGVALGLDSMPGLQVMKRV